MIKALANFELDVLGVPFGSAANKDAHGEWFSTQTEFHFDKYALPPAVYYHGFGAGGPMGKPAYIGKCLSRELKGDGVWFRVALDAASALAHKVYKAAKAGVARASSGTIAHLMRRESSGHITEWPIVELSIFDIEGGKSPANQYAVAIPVAKNIYKAAGLRWPEEKTMPEGQELNLVVSQAVAAALKQRDEEQVAAAAQQAKIDAAAESAVKAARKEWELEAAKSRRLPVGHAATYGVPYAAKYNNIWRFDNLDEGDLAVAIGLLGTARQTGLSRGPSEDAFKALAIRVVDADASDAKRQFSAAKMAMMSIGLPMKADELNRTTLTSYGQEWVGVVYSSQMWENIRLDTPILGMLPTIEIAQGAESEHIPLEGTPPNFFTVAQATSQDSNPGPITRTVRTSQMSTNKRIITAGKLGAATYWTGELEEDSLIRWVPQLRRSMEQESGEVLEHVIIDGDMALTADNINSVGQAPNGPPNGSPFILFDGFRKVALIINPANSRDADGTLQAFDFLRTMKMLGVAGTHALQKDRVGIIIDANTHWASLEMPNVLTADKVANPTIEDGILRNIFGYSVHATANMHRSNRDAQFGYLASPDGRVHSVASNNTRGSILGVRWDQWRLGWKRRISFEMTRVPSADATEIVSLMRVGLIYRDNQAAAITRNVGVNVPALTP